VRTSRTTIPRLIHSHLTFLPCTFPHHEHRSQRRFRSPQSCAWLCALATVNCSCNFAPATPSANLPMNPEAHFLYPTLCSFLPSHQRPSCCFLLLLQHQSQLPLQQARIANTLLQHHERVRDSHCGDSGPRFGQWVSSFFILVSPIHFSLPAWQRSAALSPIGNLNLEWCSALTPMPHSDALTLTR